MAKAWHWCGKQLSKAWNWLRKQFDSSFDYEAANRAAEEYYQAKKAQIEQDIGRKLAEREQRRQQERQRAGQVHEATMAEIGRENLAKHQQLDSEYQQRMAENESDLARAHKQWQEALEEARRKRQAKEAEGPSKMEGPEDLLAGQAARIGTQGTFVAANVLGLQARGVTDRMADGIDKIERNTRPLRDAEELAFAWGRQTIMLVKTRIREGEQVTGAPERTGWDYDGRAKGYDQLVAQGNALYARYDETLDLVIEHAQIRADSRVLDIGIGTGNLALRCAERGAWIVGLDPSVDMLDVAARKLARYSKVELRRVEQPFLAIPCEGESFDAVISTYAYHHVPAEKKPAAMAEMLRVLKPSGKWVLGDLLFETAEAEAEALARYRWLEPEYFEHIDDLRELLASHGIALETAQMTPVTWVVWGTKP